MLTKQFRDEVENKQASLSESYDIRLLDAAEFNRLLLHSQARQHDGLFPFAHYEVHPYNSLVAECSAGPCLLALSVCEQQPNPIQTSGHFLNIQPNHDVQGQGIFSRIRYRQMIGEWKREAVKGIERQVYLFGQHLLPLPDIQDEIQAAPAIQARREARQTVSADLAGIPGLQVFDYRSDIPPSSTTISDNVVIFPPKKIIYLC